MNNLRDASISNITFTDIYGRSYTIKDMREYPSYSTWFNLDYNGSDDIDEIASRQDVYGQASENEYYKIFEYNIADIWNSHFDLSILSKLRIPA